MPFPYHVDSFTTVLCQLKDGRYQIVRNGKLTTVLAVSGYLLVKKDVATLLQDCKVAGVSSTPATLYDPVGRVEIDEYCSLRVDNVPSPATLQTIDLSGSKVWRYGDNALFVSAELKPHLERFADLDFSEGFSMFAGDSGVRADGGE